MAPVRFRRGDFVSLKGDPKNRVGEVVGYPRRNSCWTRVRWSAERLGNAYLADLEHVAFDRRVLAEERASWTPSAQALADASAAASES